MSNSDCDEMIMETTIADMSTFADMLRKQQSGQTLFENLQGHIEVEANDERNSSPLQEEFQTTETDQTYSVLIPPFVVPQNNNNKPQARVKKGTKLSPHDKERLNEKIKAHIQIQELFAHDLSELLGDEAATSLQCCLTITNNKPCGCIRKYILNGSHWKELSTSLIDLSSVIDVKTVNDEDASFLTDSLVRERASNLLQIFHKAAELKKEKWYTIEESDQKSSQNTAAAAGDAKSNVKVKRRYIGLGNGRKRSKRYEEFVLSQRNILRKEHFLCEKAAQKLLGYSINFLYKKLRTDPQKTSRLVATNNTGRANKVSRSMLTLERLQEISESQHTSCCIRNCITWFVKNHFDKIVCWRQRLKDSGQRGTQEIVREVYLMRDLFDVVGGHPFCLNLVHWITGCSFKKIRRVRDHMKKDPETLPEHGLKKYFKSGLQQQTNQAMTAARRVVSTTGMYQVPTFDPGMEGMDDQTIKYVNVNDITGATEVTIPVSEITEQKYLTIATVTVGSSETSSGDEKLWIPPTVSQS